MRLGREKDLVELFAGVHRVCAQVANVHLLVVGRVVFEAVTPDRACEYGIAEICRFVGMREDMPELYGPRDVVVLPSYRKGLRRGPMDASAMGVACIVTNIRAAVKLWRTAATDW